MASSSGGRILGAVGAVVVTACGAGTPVAPASLPEKLDVRVSAGAPVAGAVVTVYAISDVTGLPDGSVGAGGVIGSAGPTDSSGRATVSLASRGYSGPVQVVASGSSMSYPDPSAAQGGEANSVIQVPATFALSSYVARFTGAAPVVPVTLLTTLADRAALAWARGRHPAQRTPTTITAALTARDPLFVAHVTKDPAAWNPASLRSTVPADLTDGPHTLVDAAYAALLDLGLNRLARDEAAKANSSAVTAVVLVQVLQDDLDADGRFDGRGVGGLLLAIPGNPPIALDDQTLRVPLAQGLDEWIRDAGANKSGIGQADLVSAKVYDALTTDASDLFGGPPAPGVFDPVDRTPPALAFATAPPAYTNQSTLALQIQATDATGVLGVFAESGTKQFTAVQGAEGGWTLSIDLLPGHNPITVWGQDTSQAANSGLGAPEPYQYGLDVLLDTSPPTAIYDASFASYVPEQGLNVVTNRDGTPRLPAAPELDVQRRKPITPTGDIVKMATMLSAGGSLDVAELETTNSRNVPVLRFAVHFDPSVDAPIDQARYAVQVTCTGCAYPERSGSLLPSPEPGQGFLFFDLPLSTETVPDLETVSGTATMSVKLSLADAAGNESAGIDGGTYAFHVIGPRLLVAEDPSYAAAGDPKSTFMYAASAPAYSALFDPAALAFLPEKQVRLIRYVIVNPWPEPVLANVAMQAGAWAATETWRGEMLQLPALAYNADGMSFSGSSDWAATCNAIPTFPCGGTVADQDTKFPIHSAGAATQYTCEAKLVNGAPNPKSAAPADLVGAQQASAPAELRAFTPGAPWDSTPAQVLAGAFVVPAATATAPGRLNVYVTRPAGGGARTVPLAFGALNANSPTARFEQWVSDHWMDSDPAKVACTFDTFTIIVSCGICGSTGAGCLPCAVPITVTNSYRHWWAYRHVRFLAGATDELAGTIAVSSSGLVTDGSRAFGEPAAQASSINVQRSIAH
jgi:hypothetical protein